MRTKFKSFCRLQSQYIISCRSKFPLIYRCIQKAAFITRKPLVVYLLIFMVYKISNSERPLLSLTQKKPKRTHYRGSFRLCFQLYCLKHFTNECMCFVSPGLRPDELWIKY